MEIEEGKYYKTRAGLIAGLMKEKTIGRQKAAEILGIHVNTLLRWEKKGIVHPFRTPTGWRRYDVAEIEALARGMGRAVEEE